MDKAALIKHDIYNKLAGFSEKDLASIANFVDFMRHQKKITPKKVISDVAHQSGRFTFPGWVISTEALTGRSML